jgi:hypothetical protein
MMIELLYNTFRNKIYKRKVFIYIIEMLLVHIMLWMTEVIHHDKNANHYNDGGFTDLKNYN